MYNMWNTTCHVLFILQGFGCWVFVLCFLRAATFWQWKMPGAELHQRATALHALTKCCMQCPAKLFPKDGCRRSMPNTHQLTTFLNFGIDMLAFRFNSEWSVNCHDDGREKEIGWRGKQCQEEQKFQGPRWQPRRQTRWWCAAHQTLPEVVVAWYRGVSLNCPVLEQLLFFWWTRYDAMD